MGTPSKRQMMGSHRALLGLVLFSASACAFFTNGDKEKAAVDTATAAAEAKVNAAVASGKHELTISHDHTMREGNGDNLPYMGIDYLGMGYDLLKGNPHGDPDTMLDPGFRVPAVSLTWSQSNQLSRDERDLQPVEGWAYPETACRRASSSKEQSTMSEYESSLSTEASVEASGGGYGVEASFQASAGYESFSSEVASSNSERFEMTSFCFTHVAGLNQGPTDKLKPHSYFEEWASTLPKVPSDKCHRDYQRCIHLENDGKILTVKAKKEEVPEGVEKSDSSNDMVLTTGKKVKKNSMFSWDPEWNTLVHQESGLVLGVTADKSSETGYTVTLKDDYPNIADFQNKEGSKAIKAEDKWEYDDNSDVLYVTVPDLPEADASDDEDEDEEDEDDAAFLEEEESIIRKLLPKNNETQTQKAERKAKARRHGRNTKENTAAEKDESHRRGRKLRVSGLRNRKRGKQGKNYEDASLLEEEQSVSKRCGRKCKKKRRARALLKKMIAERAAAARAAAAAKAKADQEGGSGSGSDAEPQKLIRLALRVDKDGKIGLWQWNDTDADNEVDAGAQWQIQRLPEEKFDQWAQFFKVFGTHFVSTVHLGGKMVYTCDLTSSSVEKVESSGVSASMAVEASYEGFGASASAGASASMSSSQKAANALSKVEKKEKTIVIGGKPSESDPADPAAFGEWAATVEDNPMPIKYSLRPLSALGTKDSPTLDFETYNLMLELYESGLLRAKKEKNAADELEKGSSTLEPGEEITSGMKLKDHVAKVVFEIKPNGLMTLTDKFNNKLWTSGVTRSDSDGPFRLAYQMDGDLVLYSKDGSRVWASNTKYGNCGNRNPGMVRISKGSLEILPESTKEGPIWSTKSTNSNGAPTKADDQYWTCGWNRCQEKCVRHCQHAGYRGTCHEEGPGNHDIGSLGGNDQLSSIEVKNGCVAELFQHAHFTGRKWTFAHSAHYVGNGVNDQTSSMRIKSCTF